MKFPSFAYKRAGSLPEALSLLADPEARPIAGGQSLLASLAFRLSTPSLLVDISALADMSGVTLAGGTLCIGALTTHAELGRNSLVAAHAPLLREASALIAHAAIRNRGTIGGSLAYADPASELPACCLCLGADIIAVSAAGERRIAARDFFTGLLTTALVEGELIKAVALPAQKADRRTAIVELVRRSGDYAMAGCAAALDFDGGTIRSASLAMFGVGETAVLADRASAALAGRPLDETAIDAAAAALVDDIDPPADQHGGPDTKRHLAGVALQRALRKIQGTA